MLSEATLPDTRPADATNGDLPELLDRMIAAKQLTATDARSFLASPRTGAAALTEENVLRWLAREYGVGFVTLDELEPDKQVLSLFPARLLLRDELLPLRRSDGQIEIATSRLFATQGLDGLKALTGLRLQPVLAPSEAIQREMKKRLGVGADTIDTLDEETALQVLDEGGAGSTDANLDEAAEDASIIRFVNQVLKDAIDLRASDVHLGLLNADLDAAVLRQAFFGDIEMAENLHARHDGRLETFHLCRHGYFLQDAVDAVADAQLVLEGFQMDVGGAQVDRVFQDLVDETDDRGVLGGLVEIGIGRPGATFIEHLQRGFLVERVDGVGANAEPFLHFALDRLGWRQHGLQTQTGQRLQAIQPLGREQPAGRDLDLTIDPPERKQFVPQEQPGGKERQHLLVRLKFVEGNEAHAVFASEPAEHALLGQRGRASARQREEGTGVRDRELLRRDHAAEQFRQGAVGGVRGHGIGQGRLGKHGVRAADR